MSQTAIAKRMGVDPAKKIYLNIEKYGNMSAASSAVALTEAVQEGRVKKGDLILMSMPKHIEEVFDIINLGSFFVSINSVEEIGTVGQPQG